ncbi:DUF6918 family protein [Dermatophilus congolensis]|nr:hypothetical protein [Dermatophilus congolensis]MBO3130542.1 hypothetical protein [Dermatophilus congolensis]MBO3130828.1 hypothetical protein [Dermatophilus congolensis]MBO3135014.1 hypothetical protein [Dermatophilus congolensis]MBO3137253.1 hypothetical protein [Dermatophilus congolensis]MBO3139498.1 hypothetical protein [Dermatophilus congolensis]
MAALSDVLCDSSRRDQVVAEVVSTIEQEVTGKSGISGMAFKTAFKAVQKMSPDLVRTAVDRMLPDAAEKLDPLWQEKGAVPFGDYLLSRSDEAADALLSVTDERAARPNNAAVAKIYNTVRPKAKSHVVEALPAIGRVIEKHAA